MRRREFLTKSAPAAIASAAAVRLAEPMAQAAAQSHSAGRILEAARMVRSGRIGAVRFVRVGGDRRRAFHTVRQVMGEDAPLSVSASGRQATLQYPAFVVSWEPDWRGGAAFYGTEATLRVDAAGIGLHPAAIS
jgi:hypothetical protein